MNSGEIPKSMRAVLYSQPAQSLELVDSWPVPKPNLEQDEHLLKVHSAAITKGELIWKFPPKCYEGYSPAVEMSGTVMVSPSDSRFPPGSQVYLRITSPRSAAAREYTIGLGSELAFRPQSVTAEHAASIPVSALTAWQALFVQGGFSPPSADTSTRDTPTIQAQKKILIIGASGSVGLWTTQLARLAGLWVAGTCHTRNISTVKDFGAHEVIDYTKTSVRQWLNTGASEATFDLVLDCVGGKNSTEIWSAVNPDHGLVLSIVGPEDGVLKWVLDRPEGISDKVSGRFFIMESIGDQLQKISELIDAGVVKTVVDSVFELDDYKQAFDRADSGQTTGKVIIRVQKD